MRPHGLALRPTAAPYHTGCTLCITARLAADVRVGSIASFQPCADDFPFFPQKQTLSEPFGMAQTCHKPKNCSVAQCGFLSVSRRLNIKASSLACTVRIEPVSSCQSHQALHPYWRPAPEGGR